MGWSSCVSMVLVAAVRVGVSPIVETKPVSSEEAWEQRGL